MSKIFVLINFLFINNFFNKTILRIYILRCNLIMYISLNKYVSLIKNIQFLYIFFVYKRIVFKFFLLLNNTFFIKI